MNKKDNSKPTKESKRAHRLLLVETFLSMYRSLGNEGSRYGVEQFLALSAYGSGSMGYYDHTWNLPVPEHDYPSCFWFLDLNEAWSNWANMVKKANLTPFEREEAVREMLGALLALKNVSPDAPLNLRALAEQALQWTTFEADNCAMTEMEASPEWKKLTQELESGMDPDEWMMKVSALRAQWLSAAR